MPMIEMSDGKIVDFRPPADSYQQHGDAWFSFAKDSRAFDPAVTEWLHKTKSGRYVLIGMAKDGPFEVKWAEYLEARQAARWLLLNQQDIPEELKPEAEGLVC